MIQISKRKYVFLTKLLHRLVDMEIISAAESDRILTNLTPMNFDWRRLSRYCLWIGLFSLVIAIKEFFFETTILLILARIFLLGAGIKLIASLALASFCYFWGASRRMKNPEKIYTNESIMFFGVLANAGAIYSFGEIFGSDSNHYSLLVLFATICYGGLGYFLQSKMIWCFGLLSFAGWLGAETGYMSGWGAYYLGLNYPLRFVIFGISFLFCTILLRQNTRFEPFYKVTRNLSLLYLFVSLWLMSIFGNYGDTFSWYQMGRIELFIWSFLFGLASVFVIYLGCKLDERAYRIYGITFLFINLYTRFFELFWNSIPTAIFFLFLALSLFYLGSRAEKIWLASERLIFCPQQK